MSNTIRITLIFPPHRDLRALDECLRDVPKGRVAGNPGRDRPRTIGIVGTVMADRQKNRRMITNARTSVGIGGTDSAARDIRKTNGMGRKGPKGTIKMVF